MRRVSLGLYVSLAACSRYEAPYEPPVLSAGDDVVGLVCSTIQVRSAPVDGETVAWTLEVSPLTETTFSESVPVEAELIDADQPTVSFRTEFAGQYFLRATAASGTDLVKVTVTDEVTTLDDVVDPEDGLFSLREHVAAAQGCPGPHVVRLPTAAELSLEAPLVIGSEGLDDNDLSFGLVAFTGSGVKPTVLRAPGRVMAVDDVAVLLAGLSLEGGGQPVDDGGLVRVGTGAHLAVFGLPGSPPSRLAGGEAERGGAVYVAPGAAGVWLEDAVLEGNEATGDGGGVYLSDGVATLRGADFVDNRAGGDGGALFVAGGMVDAGATSGFSGNHADGDGGAICVRGGTFDGDPSFEGNVPGDFCPD